MTVPPYYNSERIPSGTVIPLCLFDTAALFLHHFHIHLLHKLKCLKQEADSRPGNNIKSIRLIKKMSNITFKRTVCGLKDIACTSFFEETLKYQTMRATWRPRLHRNHLVNNENFVEFFIGSSCIIKLTYVRFST